jgi:two-component system response regulator AtoC
MYNQVMLIGVNPELQDHLVQNLGSDGYRVLSVKTIQEALERLRDPQFSAAALISNVSMRRQQDLETMSELTALRPNLQLIFMVDDLQDLHSEIHISNRGMRILKQPGSEIDSYRTIRDVIHAACASSRPHHERRAFVVATHATGDDMLYSDSFLSRVGMADVPVLLHGETGVGKEVMARRLCAYSARASRPFLKLNCAALPSELIESELFGYEKGAFTGANVDKPGKFELAQGGTILLDEIGDMDVRLQAKLLQVLQDGEVQPLGSRRIVKVDVRIMAATHRDLRRAIEEGTFREDLYYRLNVISIVIPPLRERRHEILPLAETLLMKHLQPGTVAPVITRALENAMLGYGWPGNVRELENMMRRFIVYQEAGMLIQELTSSKIETVVQANEPIRIAHTGNNVLTMDNIEAASRQAETRLLLEALEATRWNRRQAAARLNIDYKAFLYKLQKNGLVETKVKRGDVSA